MHRKKGNKYKYNYILLLIMIMRYNYSIGIVEILMVFIWKAILTKWDIFSKQRYTYILSTLCVLVKNFL